MMRTYPRNILSDKFMRCLAGFLLVLGGSLFMLHSAQADVCFAPSGGCVVLDSLADQPTSAGVENDCGGYGTEKKGQGWTCSECQANGHTYYNCTEKSCGANYVRGLNSCKRGFTHEYEKDDEGKYVYSGDKKCGRCIAPEECPTDTQLDSEHCDKDGYKTRPTQYFKGSEQCYVCLDDNCYSPHYKYCDWSSGSKDGPEGSVRAKSKEWYNSTKKTVWGSTCYECCDNVCKDPKGSQEVTSCNPQTELLQTIEYTACNSACNYCCNNVCSSGSLTTTSCSSGYYLSTVAYTECGNACNSCLDCGGYTSDPGGCYSCTPFECGGETRYNCSLLSDTCSSGSKNPSCDYGKTEVGTTDCGSTCYTCDECSDTCSSGSKSPSCGTGKHKSEVGSTECGNKCYTCEDDEIEETNSSTCTSKGSNLSFGSECCPDTNDTCADSDHDTWCNGSAIGRSCMNKGGTYKCVECTSNSDCSDDRTCNSSGECIMVKACPTSGGGGGGGNETDPCEGYTSSSKHCDSNGNDCCDYCDVSSSSNYGKYYCTCSGSCGGGNSGGGGGGNVAEKCPSGYSEGSKTGEGWDTTKSEPNGTKDCYKAKTCSGDYLPYGAITKCSTGKTLTCDGGKSGNSQCCHCVESCATGYRTDVTSCDADKGDYKSCSGKANGKDCCKCVNRCDSSNYGGWKKEHPGEGWICQSVGYGYCCHH